MPLMEPPSRRRRVAPGVAPALCGVALWHAAPPARGGAARRGDVAALDARPRNATRASGDDAAALDAQRRRLAGTYGRAFSSYTSWHTPTKESTDTANGVVPVITCPPGKYRSSGVSTSMRRSNGQRIEGFAWTICYGFSSGASTLVGQWLGAGSVANARRAAAAASTTAALVMVPFGAIAVLAAEQLTALFTTDAAIAGPAASYLRVTGAAFPAMAMEMTYEGSLAGGRCSSRVLAIGLFLNTARVPLASILARRRSDWIRD